MLGWEQGWWKAALGGCKGAPGAAAELGATGATMGWGQTFFFSSRYQESLRGSPFS